MNKICLLLTATIKPKQTPGVAISDYAQRESQYYNSLKSFLKLDVPIVFIENSDTTSDRIIDLTKGNTRFEYHTFESKESQKGKGHGEKEILDYAMEHSVLVNGSLWVVKITGRYQIRNLDRLINLSLPMDADVLINWSRDLTWADTRIVFFKKEFYKNYWKPAIEKYLAEENKIYFEMVLSRGVHQLVADGGKFKLLPIYPEYIGVNGANGRTVNIGFYKGLKFKLFYALKRWFFKQTV